MVLVAEAFLFYRARIFGVCTNPSLKLPNRLLRVKLISIVDCIPIGAVGPLILYINQGNVRINPQREIAFHVCFDPV